MTTMTAVVDVPSDADEAEKQKILQN